MADGERADVTSTARAARSLCAGSARSSRPLSATLLCHAQLIQSPCPLSSAHRPTEPACDRGSVSASAEKATTTKKNHAVAKRILSNPNAFSRDCTCMAMAIQPRRSECVEQLVGKRRRCAAGKSSVFERFRARLHIQPPDRRGYASKGGGRIVEACAR